jgi:hypothetical protein
MGSAGSSCERYAASSRRTTLSERHVLSLSTRMKGRPHIPVISQLLTFSRKSRIMSSWEGTRVAAMVGVDVASRRAYVELGKSRQRVTLKQTATRLLEVWSTKWKRENKIQHEENVRKNCRGPSLMHKGLLLPVNLHISEGWGLPSAEGQSTAFPQFLQPHGNRIGHRSAFLSSLGAVAKGGQTPANAGLGGLSSPVCPCLNRKSVYKLQTNVTSFEPVLWTNPIRKSKGEQRVCCIAEGMLPANLRRNTFLDGKSEEKPVA